MEFVDQHGFKFLDVVSNTPGTLCCAPPSAYITWLYEIMFRIWLGSNKTVSSNNCSFVLKYLKVCLPYSNVLSDTKRRSPIFKVLWSQHCHCSKILTMCLSKMLFLCIWSVHKLFNNILTSFFYRVWWEFRSCNGICSILHMVVRLFSVLSKSCDCFTVVFEH